MKFIEKSQRLGLLSSQMRFRSKFGLLSWTYVSLALFGIVLRFGPGHRSGHPQTFVLVVYIMCAAIYVIPQLLVYWDLSPEFLHERRLWSERNIAWEEVTRVSAWGQDPLSSSTLAIDYYRPAPMSDRGTIVANPIDRQQFLAEIRRHAPQATIEV